MNTSSLTSFAPLLSRFALLLFAITPVTYGTPWLAILVSAVMILSFAASFFIVYRLSKRDKTAGLRAMTGQLRDRYYDLMIAVVGLMVYSLTGLTGMIIVWLLLLISSLLEIRNNYKKGIY